MNLVLGTNEQPELWAGVMDKAPQVARRVAREYPGIDADDIEQEIYLHVTENLSTYSDGNYSDAQLNFIFLGVARRYAGNERYSSIWYSAEWIYTPQEVRGILAEAFFDPAFWELVPERDTDMVISGRGVVVSLWDIQEALLGLTPDERQIIGARYALGDALSPSQRKELQRAIDRLTMALNGRNAARGNVTTISAEYV